LSPARYGAGAGHNLVALLLAFCLPLFMLPFLTSPSLEQARNTVTPDELAFILKRRQAQLRQDPDTDPIYTASDLLRKVLPAVKWAITNILPEGMTLLGGKPKMGKSWLALGLAVAIATGGVALGTERVEAGDVLY